MYYKLPVKERMELMKSYRKANPDMSYRDMVNDYNASYEKFEDGGKKDNTNVVINKGLPIKSLEELKKESDKIIAQKKMLAALKSKDYAKEKTNYEETTRGANQMDGSGISSAELGWRYAKLTDPTFVSGAAEVIKDAYMGNKQNMLNLAGAIPIPYLSGASKFAKNVRKYYYLDKVGDITNKGQDIVQEFGNGGKKEREPIYVTNKNDPRLLAYNDSLKLYNLDQKYFIELDKKNKDVQKKVDLKYYNDSNIFKDMQYENRKDLQKTINDHFDYENKRNKNIKNEPNETTKFQIFSPSPFNTIFKSDFIKGYKKPVQPYIYKKPEEKESSKTVVHTDKAAFDKAYKAEKDSLYAYNLTSRDKYADKVNYMRMNLNSPNMSKEDIAGFTNLYKETDDYYKNINEPYRVVTVTKTKNNLKNDTGNLLEQYLKNTKLKPEEYKVIKDKQLYGQTYYSYDPKTLKVTNPVHKYENKITPAKFLAKEFPKITDKDVQNLYNRTLNDGSEPLYYTGKLTPNQEQIKGSRTPKTGYFPAAGVVEKVGTHISVIPYWKKPVIHNIYEPPVEPIQDTIKPAIKDTVKQKPIVDNVDSGLTRRWNFNASNPTLEYYDKSNKLVRSEYYKNMNDFKQGKQIKQ